MLKGVIFEILKSFGKRKSSQNNIVSYAILHHRLFEKEILKIPIHHQQKAYRLLIDIKENPQKLPPNTVRLSGFQDVYRTRIGDFRLIYQINHFKRTIFVLGISSRGNVYKLVRRMLG